MSDDDAPVFRPAFAPAEQHPRTDHPESVVKPAAFTDSEWERIRNGTSGSQEVLALCELLFRTAREPRTDPAFTAMLPQLEEIEWRMGQDIVILNHAYAKVQRFLGRKTP